jgi:hypothetical protein
MLKLTWAVSSFSPVPTSLMPSTLQGATCLSWGLATA